MHKQWLLIKLLPTCGLQSRSFSAQPMRLAAAPQGYQRLPHVAVLSFLQAGMRTGMRCSVSGAQADSKHPHCTAGGVHSPNAIVACGCGELPARHHHPRQAGAQAGMRCSASSAQVDRAYTVHSSHVPQVYVCTSATSSHAVAKA
jgi:hypothetical protein